MSASSPFDTVSDWVPDDQGRHEGAFDESWAQGRAVFGGIQTAAAIRMMRHVVPDRPVVEAHTRYVGPLPPAAFQATVEVLRSGRTITQAEVRVVGEKGVATVVLATFAGPRDSAVDLPPQTLRPDAPDPETLQALPHIPGLTPAFLQHMEMRWTVGTGPFTGSEAACGGWVRVRHGTALDGATVAFALLDTFPSPALSVLSVPAPASTVTWSGYLHRVPANAEGWWWYRELPEFGERGHVVSRGELFAPDGTLAGVKTQHVAVYDRR